jgi:hypothetical protein
MGARAAGGQWLEYEVQFRQYGYWPGVCFGSLRALSECGEVERF